MVITQELNSRLERILKALLMDDQGLDVDSLLIALGITKRTLYYDISKINTWLDNLNLGKVIISNQRVVLDCQDAARLEKQIINDERYYFSVEERQAMEILIIALSSEPVFIEMLKNTFDVSKNTILGDIKKLKKCLKSKDLRLTSSIKSGYVIEGSETFIRKMMSWQLPKLKNPSVKSSLKKFLRKSLEKLTGNDIDFFEIARCLIVQYERDIEGELFLSDIDDECNLMQASWIRSLKGHSIQMNSDEKITLMNTASYRSLYVSMQKIALQNIKISPEEIYYLIPLFLGIKTTDFVSEEQEDTFITDFANDLVRNFERVSLISFIDKERLKNRLAYHIRPLYYRLKYGLESPNPLVDNIKTMYPLVYQFTCRAFVETNSDISRMISDDELALMCVHFASQMNEKRILSGQRKNHKILIVGNENMSVNLLIQNQLEELLGENFIYEHLPVSKVKGWMLDEYILIVSTAQLKRKYQCRQLIYTGAIFTNEDQYQIIKLIEASGTIPQFSNFIRDVINIVQKQDAEGLDESLLFFDLFRLFTQREKISDCKSDYKGVQEKINDGDVWKFTGNPIWQSAVEQGCQVMMSGRNLRRLLEKMWNLFAHHREKILQIHPDVVLIHCPMQGEVNVKVDFSMIVSDKRVKFPGGQNGKVMIFFTTVDNYSHWVLLDEIYHFFENDGFVRNLIENSLADPVMQLESC